MLRLVQRDLPHPHLLPPASSSLRLYPSSADRPLLGSRYHPSTHLLSHSNSTHLCSSSSCFRLGVGEVVVEVAEDTTVGDDDERDEDEDDEDEGGRQRVVDSETGRAHSDDVARSGNCQSNARRDWCRSYSARAASCAS